MPITQPRPFFRLVNMRTFEIVCTIQAADRREASTRLLTIMSLCGQAHWLKPHLGDALEVELHPAGVPFHSPVFADGYFKALSDYVASLEPEWKRPPCTRSKNISH